MYLLRFSPTTRMNLGQNQTVHFLFILILIFNIDLSKYLFLALKSLFQFEQPEHLDLNTGRIYDFLL